MINNENIIAIRNRDISEAKKAFDEFMLKTENRFNELSHANPSLYKGITSDGLEKVTEKMLKEVAPSTPFRPEEIKLISGHSFPDIMTEKYYGVEVKSTKEDKWTSTGSSIVESTRDRYVENIYMLFGKLGGTPPEFRCRPYQDCLSNIAVTHSPRYLIDMEIKDKKEKTIFEKLNVPYDVFYKEDDKIEIVRDFYIKQARKENKQEMPWWVGKKTFESEITGVESVPTIKLLNNLSNSEVLDLKAQMVILFPQIILGDYSEAAFWLCTHRYFLSLNFRDLFSAGGQWKVLNGEKLATPYPAILGKLLQIMPRIKAYCERDTNLEYKEFNDALWKCDNKYNVWLNQAISMFDKCTYVVNKKTVNFSELKIDLRYMLNNPSEFQLEH